jgi:hypothetical protein
MKDISERLRVLAARMDAQLAGDQNMLGTKHPAEVREAAARIAELEAAARDVVFFDWSDNDPDAVAAIDRLRKAITR